MRAHTTYAIFWIPSGYSVSAKYEPLIDGFLQNVATASGRTDNVYSVATQYGDTSGAGDYASTFVGSVVDSDPFPANGCTDGPLPVCLTDAQLQAEIEKVIAAHGWPAGLAHEFFIFTPLQVGSCIDSSSSTCAYSYYCAYHGSFTSGAGTVIYADEPYAALPAAGGACDSGERPNGDDADATINLVSHEDIESITDPLLNAWFDQANYEIGDKCAWIFGQPLGSTGGSGTSTDYNEQIGKGQYYLQQEWSNRTYDPTSGEQGACVQRDMPQLVLSGTGSGNVSGSGVACSSITCDLSAQVGTLITLTAHPAAGSSFLGWQGGCTGAGTCVLTVTPTTSVVARFKTAQLPAGWAEEPLASPAGVDPLPPDTDPAASFYRVAESADGSERAVTIFRIPDYCTYDSTDSGGIFLEHQTNLGWVSDGKLTAPAIGTDSQARWSNCDEFGAEISLSADGATLLASQNMGGAYPNGYRCAAFVYERGPTGWKQAATLFPPGFGPSGSPTSDGCDYFGINSTLSANGDRAVVLSSGRVDNFVRGPSGWSHEQHLVLPSTNGCTHTIGPSRLAISGDGSRLLVGAPDCGVGGQLEAGEVYDYERSGSQWTVAQTIDTPEPVYNDLFGQSLALSRDGKTAVIGAQDSPDLPTYASSAWVYEHDAGGWHVRERLTTPVPDAYGLLACPYISGDGSQIVCTAFDTVGFDAAQGSVYAFQRPGSSWTTASTPLRLFAGDGHAQDNLGAAHYSLTWFTPAAVAVSPDGGDVATTIAAQNVGLDANDRIGYEFTTAPVIRSFAPNTARAGAKVTITGANFTGATAVKFAGVAAASFKIESATEITAVVPPTAGAGTIGVTTAKGRGWSDGSFGPLPAIASFSPSAGRAGTRVTITGTNLIGATAVEFDGYPAHFSVASPTRIAAAVPATATTGDLTVVTPVGSASSSTVFKPRPVIGSLSPGRARGGGRVRIKGTNLAGISKIQFAGLRAHYVVKSARLLVALVPKRARIGHVAVTTSGGRAVSSQRFRPLPRIISVKPRRARPGARLTIVGSNLAGALRVTFHGRRTRFRVVSPLRIIAVVPRRATSGRIIVWTRAGKAISRTTFHPRPR